MKNLTFLDFLKNLMPNKISIKQINPNIIEPTNLSKFSIVSSKATE